MIKKILSTISQSFLTLIFIFLLYTIFLQVAKAETGILPKPDTIPVQYTENNPENNKNKVTFEYIDVKSKNIDDSLGYYAILPPSYSKTKNYPVLYLLHGINGSADDWISDSGGNLLNTYQELLDENRVGEFIIICPDAGYNGQSWYMNWKREDGRNYEDYFIHELITQVETNFSILKSPATRGIAGFSMGGFGAYMLALRHPEMFDTISSLAGAINLSQIAFDRKSFGLYNILWVPESLIHDEQAKHFLKVFGRSVWNWKDYNPLNLVEKLANEKADIFKQKYFYLDVGKEDVGGFAKAAPQWEDMTEKLRNLNANYKSQRIENEGHTWEFVAKRLPELLTFHSEHFSKNLNKN